MNGRKVCAVLAAASLLATGAPAVSTAAPMSQRAQNYVMKQVTGAKAKALIAKSGPGLSITCSKIYVPADGTGTGEYFWAITKYGTSGCPSYSGLIGTYWTIYTRPSANKGQYGSTRMNKKGVPCDGDVYAAALKWCRP